MSDEPNSQEVIDAVFRKQTREKYESLAQPFVDSAIDLIRPILTAQWAAALEAVEQKIKQKYSGTGRIA